MARGHDSGVLTVINHRCIPARCRRRFHKNTSRSGLDHTSPFCLDASFTCLGRPMPRPWEISHTQSTHTHTLDNFINIRYEQWSKCRGSKQRTGNVHTTFHCQRLQSSLMHSLTAAQCVSVRRAGVGILDIKKSQNRK